MKKLIVSRFLICIVGLFNCFFSATAAVVTSPEQLLENQLNSLVADVGGHIGVAVINTSNGHIYRYHANERFPLCSTFKWLLSAAVLNYNKIHPGLLKQKIYYSQHDIDVSGYSPITRAQKNLEGGMTVSQLAVAAVQTSDNTAANLLMKLLGGPNAVTAFARSTGNDKFNLVRWEPELNSAIPGDLRDTTTPLATVKTLKKVVLGDILEPKQRKLLRQWLIGAITGIRRIRAGIPKEWRVGDKTGTGSYGTTNDIGIIWPKNCAPIILAIYYTQDKKNAKPNEAVIAKVARIVINIITKNDKCVSQALNSN